MRYYWPDPQIGAAQERLMANLGRTGIPLPLLSAHLPDQYVRVRAGSLATDPASLVVDKVRDVLRLYAAACEPRADRPVRRTP
jgi:D-tagatose-1,6-bisphosphate aldolase subunit GatZ/KbaZ